MDEERLDTLEVPEAAEGEWTMCCVHCHACLAVQQHESFRVLGILVSILFLLSLCRCGAEAEASEFSPR